MRRTLALALALTTVVTLGGCTTDGDPGPDGTTAPDAASAVQDAARPFIGMGEDEALQYADERNIDARVGTAADVGAPGDPDYEVGRLTLVLRDGVVAEVVVETATGPETASAE